MDHGILIAGLTDLSTWISFLKAALGLGVVIFVHELGHFLVAKACGVKCEKFYVGFDPPIKIGPLQLPRTLFRKQWGETEYGIGIIPLGGYVKMLGQDDNPANAAKEAERIKVQDQASPTQPERLDPRSYPAKSVPQRMAIISAGVIFNLIFGVIFATIAYRMGVKYTPCTIGGTSVGDPAWQVGLQPGDKIVQLDKDEPESEQLRFRQDLKLKMFSLEKGEDVDLQIKSRSGEKRWVTLSPNSDYQKQAGTPTIGIWMAHEPQVFALVKDSVADKSGLTLGDKIQSVTVDGQQTSIRHGFELDALMARHPTRPLELTVSRTNKETKAEETKQIVLAPSTAKRFGVELRVGPITAVQSGSVAEQAGLAVGDVLTELDGQPVGDPLTLPTRMLEFIGKPTVLSVQRGETTEQVAITPVAPKMVTEVMRRDGPIGLESLGVAYRLLPTVENVIEGSPADNAGIVAGDVLASVKLIPQESEDNEGSALSRYFKRRGTRKMLEARELDQPLLIDAEHNNWPFVVASVQGTSNKFKIDLKLKRGGEEKTFRLSPEPSSTSFDYRRGFGLKGQEDTLVASSWGEAFALGRRETWEGMRQVVLVLRKIKNNYKNLGGPITIAAVGTMEASEGLPRLLIFLTMLSANLAVLNFLPIPVLDGGHMVFLAYEGIFGKPVNERIAFGLTVVGFSMLMGLMVFVFGLDISRFLG